MGGKEDSAQRGEEDGAGKKLGCDPLTGTLRKRPVGFVARKGATINISRKEGLGGEKGRAVPNEVSQSKRLN